MKTLHQNFICLYHYCLSADFFFASLSNLLQSSTEPDKAEDTHAKLHESRVVWSLIERGQGGLPQEHVHSSQLIWLIHGLIANRSLIFDSVFGVFWHVIIIFEHLLINFSLAIVLYLKELTFPRKIAAIVIQLLCPLQLRGVDQFENAETKTHNVVTPSRSFTLMLPKGREREGTCEFSITEVNMLSVFVKVRFHASKVD